MPAAEAQPVSVYVVDEGADALLRFDDLSAAPTEVVGSGEAGNPARVALDPLRGDIYWTDVGTSGNDGRILRSRRAAAGVEPIVTGLDNPAGVAVDPEGAKLYWTDSQQDAIFRSDLDGGNVETLISHTAAVDAPNDLQLDPAAGMMYWVNGGDEGRRNGSLARATLEGAQVDVILTGRANPIGIALDPANETVYWAERGSGDILRAQQDGTGEERLVETTSPLGIALDRVRGSLYWTVYVDASTPGALHRADLSGANEEVLRADLERPLGVAIDTDPPLPVKLIAFDGQIDGTDIVLTWTTALEQQNAGFAVEQRRGDAPFEEVGWVDGAGMSNAEQTYTFRVTGLTDGVYSFRLRQVDLDGTRTYSPVVEIDLGMPERLALAPPYPNPSNGRVTLTYEVAQTRRVELSLHDALGRRVRTLEAVERAPGTYTVRLRTDGLASGLYVVRLTAGDEVLTRKITVAR